MAKFVNKRSLTQSISEQMNISQKEAANIVDLFFEEISDALIQNGNVDITGFGKFYLFERKERMGINPNTMERVIQPTSYLPKFRPSQTLKNRCNEENRDDS